MLCCTTFASKLLSSSFLRQYPGAIFEIQTLYNFQIFRLFDLGHAVVGLNAVHEGIIQAVTSEELSCKYAFGYLWNLLAFFPHDVL